MCTGSYIQITGKDKVFLLSQQSRELRVTLKVQSDEER